MINLDNSLKSVTFFVLQAVTDFTQKEDIFWGCCWGRRLSGTDAIDHFDHLEDHKGQQNEVNRDRDEVAVGKNRDTRFLEGIKGAGNAIGYVAQDNKEVGEVDFPAQEGGNYGHHNVINKRVDNLAKSPANNDANGQINYIAFDGKFPKFL